MPSSRKGMIKGLGAKYGATVRKRYSAAVLPIKAVRTCPKCESSRFNRIATGIWSCKSCGHRMAGAAFDLKRT